MDDNLVGGGPAQLTRQAVVVEPHAGVRLPVVLVDRRGLEEALGEARRADLPAEHAGPRGLRCRRVVLPAIVAATPSRVVASRCPRLCVARPPGVDDVAGVTVLGLPARVEEPLLGRRASRVGGTLRCTSRVHRWLGALRTPVVPRAPLLTDAGRRAFGLLEGRLLDKRLRLVVQVPHLGRRGGRHGP
jgi:hypothetical protein